MTDIAAIAAAAEGPIAYFLRSSVDGERPARPRDHRGVTTRAGRHTPRRARRCATSASGGTDALRPHAKDAASLDLVMLVSDGLYFNNALDGGAIPGPVPDRRRDGRADRARRGRRPPLRPAAARLRGRAAVDAYGLGDLDLTEQIGLDRRRAPRRAARPDTGESTVSTDSAWPPAARRAICMPAMLMPASPNFWP